MNTKQRIILTWALFLAVIGIISAVGTACLFEYELRTLGNFFKFYSFLFGLSIGILWGIKVLIHTLKK